MKINRSIFREYDIRAIAEEDLKGDFPYLLGRSFGTLIKRSGKKTAAIGGDNRLTTPKIKEAVKNGLLDSGCNVTDIGIVATPILYFSVRHYELDAGLMVTASHNPPEFNGFKMVMGKQSIYGKQIQRIADLMETRDFETGHGQCLEKNAKKDYTDFMLDNFKFNRKFHVGVDTGNGVAGPIVKPLFEKLGVEISGLFMESDGTFPNHIADPVVPENLKDLIQLVRKEQLEVGFAFDGDGDRLGVITENGDILWGDQLLIIYAREALEKHPEGKIIFDVKCTQALDEEVRKSGGVPIMWKTGHSLIEDKIHKEKALLAGELSGHLYFADEYFGYDDAIYASLRLLRILDETGKTVSELLKGVKEYFSTPEIRIEVPDEQKFNVVKNLQEYFRGKYPTSEIDGVKVFFPNGWALVRASNTQPALVVRIEAENRESLETIKTEFLQIIETRGMK